MNPFHGSLHPCPSQAPHNILRLASTYWRLIQVPRRTQHSAQVSTFTVPAGENSGKRAEGQPGDLLIFCLSEILIKRVVQLSTASLLLKDGTPDLVGPQIS